MDGPPVARPRRQRRERLADHRQRRRGARLRGRRRWSPGLRRAGRRGRTPRSRRSWRGRWARSPTSRPGPVGRGGPSDARRTASCRGTVSPRRSSRWPAAADAGLAALVLGDPVEAAARSGGARRRASSPGVRPPALARAEALALAGDQRRRWSSSAPPWKSRRSRRPGLVAAAAGLLRPGPRRRGTGRPRGSGPPARRGAGRLGPAAAQVGALTSEGYLANLLDLGRPPVLGLVEPQRELDRIQALRDVSRPGPATPWRWRDAAHRRRGPRPGAAGGGLEARPRPDPVPRVVDRDRGR